jgi:phage protein D
MHAIFRRRAMSMSIGVLVLTASAGIVQVAISASAYAQGTAQFMTPRGAVPPARPQLRAGTKIDIQGVGNRFSGKYVVPNTTHTIGGSGGSTGSQALNDAMLRRLPAPPQ